MVRGARFNMTLKNNFYTKRVYVEHAARGGSSRMHTNASTSLEKLGSLACPQQSFHTFALILSHYFLLISLSHF